MSEIEEHDIYLVWPVSGDTARQGDVVIVQTPLEGIRVTVPPGTESGTYLRSRGHGWQIADGVRGDLYIEIVLEDKDLGARTEHVSASFFTYVKDGRTVGPFRLAELGRMAVAGRISMAEEVRILGADLSFPLNMLDVPHPAYRERSDELQRQAVDSHQRMMERSTYDTPDLRRVILVFAVMMVAIFGFASLYFVTRVFGDSGYVSLLGVCGLMTAGFFFLARRQWKKGL